jgi:hypothetical protein
MLWKMLNCYELGTNAFMKQANLDQKHETH